QVFGTNESYTMTGAGDARDAAVPEKKTETFFESNKFLIDLVSGGAVAAVAKTAFSGNLASVARYAPMLGLNIAFKEKYKNFSAQYRDKDEPFRKFLGGNLTLGAFAGASTLFVVHPVENALARTKVRNPRLRADRVSVAERLMISPKAYKGIFRALPSSFFYNAVYFGLYDSFKVKIASGDQKLNFFSAWALALVTTSIARPFYIFGRIFKPEHRNDFRASWKRPSNWVANYLGSSKAKHFVYFIFKVIPSYCLSTIKKEGWKRLTMRSATGGLVLAAYDEIQKWIY
ncbi:hypothetical protein PMAYCL1PPCAC_20595, partial [Pristionchus mayeri]